jgi:hypothetical protein
MAASAALSYSNAQKQAGAAKNAASMEDANAKKTLAASEEAQNQANQNKPAIPGVGAMGGKGPGGGIGSTMLTGPTGVDPNSLALGKSTLLGA